MDDYQVRRLLIDFKNSQHYRQNNPRRMERYRQNLNWVNPTIVRDLSGEELRQKFIEYYVDGGGRQSLNQIWRDRIVRDVEKFRSTLLYLLDESIPVEERFFNVVSSEGKMHIDGFGKALASGLLMDSDLQKYCTWNNKTEMGFSVLGWKVPYESSDHVGVKYIKVLKQLKRLRDKIGEGLDLNFIEVDHFLHWIAAEDEGKEAVKRVSGKEVSIDLEAPEERLIQQIIEQNFDNVFRQLNLKLYDEDPEQTGAQYNTPVGRIDFLAVEKDTNDFVVIELKVGKASDNAIGQILRYMGYVKENLAGNKNVKGIILAEDIDDKARYALSLTPSIEFKKFKLNIQLTD